MKNNNFIDLVRELATYSMLIIHVISWLSGDYIISVAIGLCAIPLFMFASGMASFYSRSNFLTIFIESVILFSLGCILNLTTLGLMIEHIRIYFYYGILQIIAVSKVICHFLKKLDIKYLGIIIGIFIPVGIFLIGDFLSLAYAVAGLILMKYKEFNIRGTYYLGKFSLTIFISHHYIFFNLAIFFGIFQSFNVIIAVIILGLTIDLYYIIALIWSRYKFRYSLEYFLLLIKKYLKKITKFEKNK
ncbi:MAG: heparan-alpha-glucosaminide N-acetyltransferase domain-containing protein [Candidatus Helarchaeota archaeon]